MKLLKLCVLGFILSLVLLQGMAEDADAFCPATSILGDVLVRTCWQCMFPISVFAVTLTSGGEDSHLAAHGPGLASYPSFLCGCVCYFGVCIPGIPLGIWEPKNLVEVVRTPFCFPALGGVTYGPPVTFFHRGMSTSQMDDGVDANNHFYHVHYYIFPLWAIVGLALDVGCINYAGIYDEIDLLYLSEVDPLWKDDPLAMVFHPEGLLTNNPIATAACSVDALAAAVSFPIDLLWWCNGSWGILYPPTGNVTGSHGGQLKPAALVVSRLLNRLARSGTELWTSAHFQLICSDLPSFQIVKTQYKLQLLYPIPTSGSPCCVPLGRTMFRWGLGKTVPVVGEDFVFLLWKNQRCCLL